MNETEFGYFWIFALLTYLGPFFGLLLVFLGEIILLKKTKWVTKPKDITFPLLSLGVGIILGIVLAIVSNVVNAFGLLTGGMLFMAISEEFGLLIYAFVLFLVLFVLNWVVFFLARLLARRNMVKESGLTWKYDLIPAALPAAFFASAGPLMHLFVFAVGQA